MTTEALDNTFEVFVLNQIIGHLAEGTNPEPITGAIAREHKFALATARAAGLEEGARQTWEATAKILQRGSDQPMTGTDETVHIGQAGIKIALGLLAIEFRARAAALSTEAPPRGETP